MSSIQETTQAAQVTKSATQAAFRDACEKRGVEPSQATFDIWQDGRAYERTVFVEQHVPANFTTHRTAWRDALVKARDNAPAKTVDSDEAAYWEHEIAAYDRSFTRLLAGESKQVVATMPPDGPVDEVMANAVFDAVLAVGHTVTPEYLSLHFSIQAGAGATTMDQLHSRIAAAVKKVNQPYLAALKELAQCDGSSTNVRDAVVLAARVRLVADKALQS